MKLRNMATSTWALAPARAPELAAMAPARAPEPAAMALAGAA